MESTPTREEFEALRNSHQKLLDSLAISATADFAMSISVIGHLAAHASNRKANIESIGQNALGLLRELNANPSIPEHYKTGMTDRIQKVILKAQEQYGA
ncbi:hypothetical protein [Herbaspirillum sp. CAH-3]|uniref:hypothetical protein n=1 Tax=Herbaspirillum sp. CAH-3 TaxID=2605746 RepID=UPI0012AC83B5|nr:hypothetical protein [Herbaspirillum sp. CAH-3]MRT27625.1 hypothetical protein [Herbaspirillum sp. CAH-3]